MSDSEASASSSSSISPSPVLKKSKAKPKPSKNSKTDDHGKNEGTDPTWEFKPPPGHVLLKDAFDGGEFDWDNVKNNEHLELVVIRVPDGMKPRHLDGVKISDAGSAKSVKVGSVKRKNATFDIWSVGSETTDDCAVAGEEIRHLTCLLPRKKKGKLYPAPRGIARHLVLATQPPVPSTPPTDTFPLKNSETGKYQNPTREIYPDERLVHSFAPYGSHTTISAEEATMDVDQPEPASKKKKKKAADEEEEAEEPPSPKKSKSKKRKGAAETGEDAEPAPKKVKKSKASA